VGERHPVGGHRMPRPARRQPASRSHAERVIGGLPQAEPAIGGTVIGKCGWRNCCRPNVIGGPPRRPSMQTARVPLAACATDEAAAGREPERRDPHGIRATGRDAARRTWDWHGCCGPRACSTGPPHAIHATGRAAAGRICDRRGAATGRGRDRRSGGGSSGVSTSAGCWIRAGGFGDLCGTTCWWGCW
jgi:hypothetical protein